MCLQRIILVTNFQNLPALGAESHLIFDFGDIKLRNLAKSWFFKLIMTKPNFKKSAMTSSLLRRQ